MSKRTEDGIMDGDDPISAAGPRWSQVAQRHYDPDGREGLTTAIVYAIAAAKDVDPTEMTSPPLYQYVDAPALEDTFFGPSVDGDSRQGTGTFEFRYTDYLLKVRSDGWIWVYERTETDPQ